MAWDGCARFELQPRRVTDRSGELLQPRGHESKDPVETWLAFCRGLPGHKAVCLFPWVDIPWPRKGLQEAAALRNASNTEQTEPAARAADCTGEALLMLPWH